MYKGELEDWPTCSPGSVGLPLRGPNDTAQNLPTPGPSDRTG